MQPVKARVVGDNAVAGVAKGGTVDLDPAMVNIAALVAGGHITLSKTAARSLDEAAGRDAEAGA